MICSILSAVLLAALPTSPNVGRARPGVPFDDLTFVKAVALGGLYDGCLSNLTGLRTRSRDVRDLAAQVAATRIAGGARLRAAAKDAGIELPARLDADHQQQFEQFKDLTGDDLDRAYVKAMVERHTAGVILFTRASRDAKSPAVREFATRALPTLRKHLEAAKALEK